MLKLTELTKDYKVADSTVRALDGVTLAFRKSEFVSILGPSGCGKTTLLNIIGGLDRYTSGDVTIGGVSTREFKDADWDVYRNHRIGFIFQSYNLIPHQTVLGNVELALTIAGIGKQERVERAKRALDRVGLSGQYNKRPNQLSGGQCQRVAIARALVNEPEILLADEPTGALDSETSIQIMELVKEIATEKLVIMVTHNPDLAEKYSTRIIRLLDGRVVDDSMPYSPEEEAEEVAATNKAEEEARAEEERLISEAAAAEGKSVKKVKKARRGKEKAKMSPFTAFRLSGQNLLTKKARTVMTSIAGAIGIIGVSLVLAMSYGVRSYINDMQNDMLSGNPITVQETALDMDALLGAMTMTETGDKGKDALKEALDGGYIDVNSMIQYLVDRQNQAGELMIRNDINADYLNYIKAIPKEDAAAILLNYGLDVSNNIYTDFRLTNSVADDGQVEGVPNKRTMSLSAIRTQYIANLEHTDFAAYASYITTIVDNFKQAPESKEYILEQYDVLSGKLAEKPDEVMIVLDGESRLTDILLAQLGYYTQDEFMNLVYRDSGDETLDSLKDPALYKEHFTYDELLGKTFTWYPNDDIFTPTFTEGNPGSYLTPFSYEHIARPDEWAADAYQLKVVGILMPKETISYGCLTSGFYYTTDFAEYVISKNKGSQIATEYDNIINNYTVLQQTMGQMPGQEASAALFGLHASMGGIVSSSGGGITYSYDYIWQDPADHLKKKATDVGYVGTPNSMTAMMAALGNVTGGALGGGEQEATADMNIITLRQLGGVELAASVAIYPYDFEHKDAVLAYLDRWNSDEDITFVDSDGNTVTLPRRNADGELARDDVVYTDTLSIVIDMINTFIDIVTVALVGFTALSLVVSCVMIAIITYVSVVERIKEIGVIRALGGRKKDVSRLFTAETFIIGLASGLIGILVTYLVSMIINAIVGSITIVSHIAILPWWQALIMIGVSIALTLISGVFPARAAAKKDPVVALRTE